MNAGQVGQIRIVKAGVADCELINLMAWEVFPHTYAKILSEEQIEYMMHWMYDVESLYRQMSEQCHEYFVAYENARPVGYVSIRPDGDACFHLEKIYILPDYQKKHYGSMMFNFVISYIKDNYPQADAVELNVNRYNPALAFYNKMGMRIVREGDFNIGNGFYMNDYIMRLEFK